jgi:hypothetical protein
MTKAGVGGDRILKLCKILLFLPLLRLQQQKLKPDEKRPKKATRRQKALFPSDSIKTFVARKAQSEGEKDLKTRKKSSKTEKKPQKPFPSFSLSSSCANLRVLMTLLFASLAQIGDN